MTEDGVLLTDGQNCIFLHPPERFPDGQGYHHQVDLVAGPFRGTIDATSYESLPGGLRAFRDQLVVLHETLQGEASLSGPYDCLSISLKGDRRGHVEVQVHAAANDQPLPAQLSFRFAMDQTQLPEVIVGIERILLS
jgi:hypothetical protein